jgi:site-specific recombinase XerD
MSATPDTILLSDQITIGMWVARCEAATTQRSYRRHAASFLAFTGKSLAASTAEDVRAFYEEHVQGTPSTRATTLSAVKSLFSYAHDTGIMSHNPGAAVMLPLARRGTVRRVVDHRDIERMILLETNERNFAILIVAYSGGLMTSELAGLKWSDAIEHESGAATLRVVGYKGRIREVRISIAAWRAVSVLRGHAVANDPIFVSKKGGHLGPTSIHAVVKAAVARAGLPSNMSTYWLRHAQTAHSLAAGTPLHLLQKKLGHTELETTQRYVRMFSVNKPMFYSTRTTMA